MPVALMVDDSAEDAALLDAAFKASKANCRLRAVSSSEEAVRYLEGKRPYSDRASNPLPRLVLLDIQMPGQDGFHVLEWIRSRKTEWHHIPVLMLTTSHDYAEIKKAYDLGANSYLVKPTGFQDLVKLVSDTMSFWLSHNKGIPPAN